MSGMMVDHKATLNRLAGLIQKEKACAAEIYSEGSYADDKKQILDIASQKTGEEFIVLIIGAFSSGKTSMINALIGEDLLPTGFLPETAVLGELHYGSKKRITLYPKKGMWEGGDKPFDLREVTTEEISRYVSLSTEDAINSMEKNIDGDESQSRINAKFEKMIIYWPLDILKDGVVLVDSPGINDPYSNDYIVNDYLPKADAIVYVMDSQKAYTATDKNQLEMINALGRKNILTGYTFYDIVERQTRRTPERLRTLRKTLINHMMKHTDLGEVSIHFLDSMGGLDAKLDNDREALRRSGFEGFEDYLGQYLVEGKGTDQVKNMVSIITIQANAMTKDAERFNCAASQDTEEIKERIAEAEGRLQVARNNSFQTGRNYRNHLENYLPETEKMVRAFITERLPNLIDLEDFQPETTLPDSISKFNPMEARRKATALQDECQQEIIRRMNLEYKKWITTELSDHLKNAVRESAEQIKPDLDRIAVDLTNITDTVAGYKQSSESHIGNIALGVAFGFLTGDFLTGAMAPVYGARTLARAAAYQLGAGFGVGLLLTAIGAPITAPIILATGLGAAILAILTGDNKGKAARIKVQAVRDFKDSFRDPKAKDNVDEMVAGVMNNVKEYINSACTAMETALAEDIENTKNTIQQIIDSNNLSLTEKKEQINRRNVAVAKLEKLKIDAGKIAAEYGIKEIVAPESGIKDIRVRAR